MRPQTIQNLSTGGGLLAVVLWSTTIALTRSLSEQLGTLGAGAAVFLTGGVLCLVMGWRSRGPLERPRPSAGKYLVGCGLLFVAYTVLLFGAVGLARDREEVLEIGLLNYLWPALTILFSLVLLGQRANWWLAPGTALALTGMVFVLTQSAEMSWASFLRHWGANPWAYFMALAAAVCWGLYSNLTRRWSKPEQSPGVIWFIPITGLVLLGLWLVGPPEPQAWSMGTVGEVVFLGTVTAVAYGLWEIAMRKGDLVLVGAASYFTPLLSTLVSCAYLKVTPGVKLWIGCCLLVGGSLLTWRSVSGSPLKPGSKD